MTPIPFEKQNKVLTPTATNDGRDLQNISVLTDGQQCLSCWQMTWRERLAALLHGRLWLGVHSGATQPAIWMEVKRDVL